MFRALCEQTYHFLAKLQPETAHGQYYKAETLRLLVLYAEQSDEAMRFLALWHAFTMLNAMMDEVERINDKQIYPFMRRDLRKKATQLFEAYMKAKQVYYKEYP